MPQAVNMPAKRVCSQPGCPTLTDRGGRCAKCQAEYEIERGTPAQRGYDARHRREAPKAKAKAVRERALCPFCREPMLPGQELHYDHETPRSIDPTSRASRASHARCNLSAGGRLAHGLPPKGTEADIPPGRGHLPPGRDEHRW